MHTSEGALRDTQGGTQGRVPRAHPSKLCQEPGCPAAHCCFLSSTLTQVGCQLAIIGDDINRRYGSDIEAMLQQLQPTADNAPDLFYKIACRYQPQGPRRSPLPPASHAVSTRLRGALIHGLGWEMGVRMFQAHWERDRTASVLGPGT